MGQMGLLALITDNVRVGIVIQVGVQVVQMGKGVQVTLIV